MAITRKINIAVVGLGFGANFARIYRDHPDVGVVGVCDASEQKRAEAADMGFDRVHADFDEVVSSPDYDAIHVCLPVNMHEKPTLKVLAAGKHCACAVPMARSIEDLNRIVEAQRRSHKNYMMMETGAYSREFFHVKSLYDAGAFGDVQFLYGLHHQDLEHLSSAWHGFPPMQYITHAIGPILKLVNGRADRVVCMGSGHTRASFREQYGNPYPIEVALFHLAGSDIAVEISRTTFETAVVDCESFDVYGTRATFLWGYGTRSGHKLIVVEDPTSATAGQKRVRQVQPVEPPFRPDLLPPELASYASGGHGGSHPHLVHEFVRSIVEERPAAIDAVTAANWCAPGICAHESAMRGGDPVDIPVFQ